MSEAQHSKDETENITWESWKKEYGKKYSKAEDAEKKLVWEETLAFVTAHNKRYEQGLESFVVGMNMFAVEGPPINHAFDKEYESKTENAKQKSAKQSKFAKWIARFR